MRVLITGDRNWDNRSVIETQLSDLPPGSIIVQGGAKGADTIAMLNLVPYLTTITYPAEWELHGKAAGPIRNRKMLDTKPDLVLGFHNDITTSKGTRDCLLEAQRRGIPTRLFNDQGIEYNVG